MAKQVKQKFGPLGFSMFLDRQVVLNKISKNQERVMTRVGGFGRTTIKRSMRPGGKTGIASAPGEPPRYQTKKLRDAIVFGYDGRSRSVVIGPLKKSSRSKAHVPLLLEQGGQTSGLIRVEDKRPSAKEKPKKDRTRLVRMNALTIAPRPYVGPDSVNYPPIIDKWQGELKDSLTK